MKKLTKHNLSTTIASTLSMCLNILKYKDYCCRVQGIKQSYSVALFIFTLCLLSTL